MRATTRQAIATALLWTGRGLALLLFLFWGGFFVDHLSEWFLDTGGRYPPPYVWVAQVFHFVMLLGLGLMLRWGRLGSVVLAVGMIGYVGATGHLQILAITLVNLLPIACVVALWAIQRPRVSPST